MRPTRRFWATVLAGVAGLCLAALLEAPRYLVGTVGVAAWLAAQQYRFVRAADTVASNAAVTRSVSPERVVESEPIQVTLAASCPAVAVDDVTVSADSPVSAGTDDGRTSVTVAPGEEARSAFSVTVPVAGRHAFSPPVLSITSAFGLFEETVRTGEEATITVVPRRPQEIHVGEGGDRIAVAAGEHSALHGRRSTQPAEVREYQPGDPAKRLDWKATARFGEPFVREFEVQGDRETFLVVDHRSPMSVGSDGETALDYCREIAIALADDAAANGDPYGLYTVGDDGITNEVRIGTGRDHDDRIRTVLHDLEPTAERGASTRRTGPSDAARIADRLDDDTDFSRTLRPFLDAGEYVERLADDPLFETVRRRVAEYRGTPWTVVLTDDTHRAEIREAVKLARRGNRQVAVFIAPRPLYERRGLTDAEETYRDYVDFEEFRRDLASLDRVSAFEVAPRERVLSLLGSRDRDQTRGVRT